MDIINQLYNNFFIDAGISISVVEPESHNAEYHGVRFHLNKYPVRFRKAKVTPAKQGLFVVAWEKNKNRVNQPYHYDTAPDFMMVYCEESDNKGLFIFDKNTLLKNKILSSHNQKGKMGFRVYPSWSIASSPQALKTQKWQSEYFIDLNCNNAIYMFRDYFI